MARPALGRRPAAILFDFGGTLDAPGVTWKERAWRLYRDAGVVSDAAVFDPVFYKADDALGIAAGDALFVGDSRARDMEGARALAMPHVWVVEAGTPASPPCCAGDPVIHALDELEALLR